MLVVAAGRRSIGATGHAPLAARPRGGARQRSVWPTFLAQCALLAILLVLSAAALAQSTFDATHSFAPASVISGGTSSLQVQLNANFPAVPVTGIGFSDTFPPGMALAPGTSISQCGGTLTLSSGGFTFANGSVTAPTSCTVQVNVTGTSTVDVTLTNTTSSFSYNASGVGRTFPAVSADLFVKGGTAPAITSAPPGAGLVGVPYTHAITVTGTAPVTVNVTGLPPGLAFNPATLQITGTPKSPGSYPGTITASNGFLPDATRTYTLVVAPAVSIKTSSPLPAGTAGAPYAVSFVASNGRPPYTWARTAGALPPGLALSPPGVLSGTPLAAGDYTFDVRVTDAAAGTDTRTFTLAVVVPRLMIVTPAPLAPPLDPATPFGVDLAATGGVPPYRWSPVQGLLPPGLTLDPSGHLAGTPTRAGTFAFSVQVTDSRASVDVRDYTLSIVQARAAMSVAVAPNPAVSGQRVMITATIGGALAPPTGVVDAWVAGTGERCPDGFAASDSGAVPAPRSATLAGGEATITLAGLGIDDYTVCVRYAGDGLYGPATAGPFSLAVIKGVILAPPPAAAVKRGMAVEYYNASLDHYFLTVAPDEIQALDAGRIGGWQRTGFAFWSEVAAGDDASSPVCRYYLPPATGDSHFLSASPQECARVQAAVRDDPRYASLVLETPSAFFMRLPDALTGACAPGTSPVYRLWNGRADSNHRYTADRGVRAAMLAKGFVAEGYGADGTAMCAP